ncbi:MAG: hypothetical protein ACTHJ1_15545 [Bordetella sp.]|uniref:hypothetical protein n=1 Tax=Bordetella sp. TaxID=28081 RepID=UPI003F7C44B1
MAARDKIIRVVRETVLVVGQGYAEEAFLKHLRELYTSRVEGRNLTVRNARGNGAESVVSDTVRIARQLPHSHVALLFSADADIGARAVEDAHKKKILPVYCDPCVEAILLRMHGDTGVRSSADHKRVFEERFSLPATVASVYPGHFPRELLDAVRAGCAQLEALLGILGC